MFSSRVTFLCLLLTACAGSDEGKDDTAGETGDSDTAESGDTGETNNTETGDSSDTGETGETGDSGETGETGDSGDTGGPCLLAGPTVTVSKAMPTVFTVEWTTAAAGRGVIEWGYDAAYTDATALPTDSATEHRVVVAGPAPDTTIHWRIHTELDSGSCDSEDQTLAIGHTEPDTALDVRLTASEPTATHGFRVFPLTGPPNTPDFVLIVDDEGRIVWWLHTEDGLVPVQAELDLDQTHINILLEDDDRRDDVGGLLQVSLDQSEQTFIPLHYCHHGFTQLPDGSFVWLQADPMTYEGEEIAGDALVHMAHDGSSETVLFTTWDHFTPDVEALALAGNGYYPLWLDWTHSNSVHLRADGSYLVSMHNVNSIVNVAADGSVRWVFGGQSAGIPSDFTFSGDPDDLFYQQHNAVEVDGGFIVFDNDDGRATPSAAIEYTLDESGLTASEAWRYDMGGTIHATLMGDVQRLDSGNTLVWWGNGAYLTEVSPAGDLLWSLNTPTRIPAFGHFSVQLGGQL